jgi:hypothetical protein
MILVVSLFALACQKNDRAGGAPQSSAASAPVKEGRAALLEVHAEMDLEMTSSRDADALAAKVGDIAREKGGYVALAELASDAARSHLVVRVPPAEIGAIRAALAGAGSLTRESQSTTDVTDAIADLDARAHAARMEEARLLNVLDERTGSVGDILAAEKALADVRERIERIDAESRVSRNRVALATVDVWIAHPASGSDGSLASRLTTAARDGLGTACAVAITLGTLTLRAAPTLALLVTIALAVALAMRRALHRLRRAPHSN